MSAVCITRISNAYGPTRTDASLTRHCHMTNGIRISKDDDFLILPGKTFAVFDVCLM